MAKIKIAIGFGYRSLAFIRFLFLKFWNLVIGICCFVIAPDFEFGASDLL